MRMKEFTTCKVLRQVHKNYRNKVMLEVTANAQTNSGGGVRRGGLEERPPLAVYTSNLHPTQAAQGMLVCQTWGALT